MYPVVNLFQAGIQPMRIPGSLIIPLLFLPAPCVAGALTDLEQLGKRIFFDPTLSSPPGQSCSACHDPATGFTGPDSEVNAGPAAYEGAVHGRHGKRKPPSAAYATPAPALHPDPEEDILVGGNFWNGRATGWLLGNPAADQAQQPFLNPVEQNLFDASVVVEKVCGGTNGEALRAVFGQAVCGRTVEAYNAVAQALAAYEASSEVNAFGSKYDWYLKDPRRYPLNEQEARGLELFEAEDKGNCAACHPSRPGPNGEPPLFTDFSYDNLGTPRNPENPWYRMPADLNPDGERWVDEGLGGFLRTVPRFAERARATLGKHKVPTLRNVDKRPSPGFVKAFMHNGSLKSLEQVMHFYNTRDTKPRCEGLDDPRPAENCWPVPEVEENVNTEELGDLGLTGEEEAAIVAFMKTLSDGWEPPQAGESSYSAPSPGH
jgi:cytochrome c peroxidase